MYDTQSDRWGNSAVRFRRREPSAALFRLRAFFAFFCLMLLGAASALPADSFSVHIDLKFTGAVDLRQWERPFSFSKALLADTTAALLKADSRDFKTVTEIDSAFTVVKFRRLLLGEDWLLPVVFSREEYQQFRLRRNPIIQFREESLKSLEKKEARADGEALTIEIPFKIKSKTFNKIFGGDRVRLRISGNINIEGGFRREDRSQVETVYGQDTDYSFHIDQRQNFKITGEVGDKVSVYVDQNSERTFEFENSLKLTYTGYEDEIIQKIEAGNVSLQLAGTKLATFSGQNKGLFGLKSELKFGALSLTTIASLEKGEKNKLTVTGGAQQTTRDIPVKSPSTNRYFFLSKTFREQFRIFTEAMMHTALLDPQRIDANNFYVYKWWGENTLPPSLIEAYAVYDDSAENNPSSFYNKDTVETLYASGLILEKNYQAGRFVLLDPSQYYVDPLLGYIRLNSPMNDDDDVLAVAYLLNDGTTYGTLNPAPGETAVLKLIRPKNPHYDDDTWPLAWRHVYSLQGVSIEREGFSLKIAYNPSGTTEMETIEFEGEQQTFLTLFGLDIKNESGQDQPDGNVDDNPAFINYSYGEIIFPDLRPFDPAGYYIMHPDGSLTAAPFWGDSASYPDSLRNPLIYEPPEGVFSTDFSIKAEFKSVMAVYELGFNVLEGSEEVYLGGRQLQRGTDYVIDYYSGRLTILNQSALSPSANLEIVYESGELFQLDKKTLMGIRGEYQLWDQSFIGVTALYLNEKPLQDRVRVGNEPLRNFLWDVNTSMVFKPKFLTAAVDFLPLVETEAPSELKVEAEFAQVHPNPNSLDNEATGDPDGVAYVDDFESIKKTTPLGIMRRQWHHASHPFFNPEEKFRNRGTFVWFNPYDQVKITDIWPDRPVNPNVAQRTHVMTFYFSPVEPDTFPAHPKQDSLATSWGGVIRALSAGYHNQENSEYIEIILKARKRGTSKHNPTGKLHIDLGQINEDVIDNDSLDTEDKPLASGVPYGDGFCDQSEDLGMDGRGDPNDFWDFDGDGVHDSNFNDNWYYNPQNPYDVWGINGTEGNYNDEGGRYPDTEDLNNNNWLDEINNFFRYTIDLSETEPDEDYGLGQGGVWWPTPRYLVDRNENEWKMYRIPLKDGVPYNNPQLTQIQYARIWVDGFVAADTIEISIATLEIVGNEWEAVPVTDPTTGEIYEPVSVEVINSYDNSDYVPPPGVAGYHDPVTDIVSQEQSLLLRINQLAAGDTGVVARRLWDYQDYLEYRKLKMFVHGGGIVNQEAFDDHEIWMFFRFGADTSKNYYEYRQRVWPGWDERNNIEIDLDELPRLKLADSVRVIGEDTLAVVGNPSLSQIRQFTVGIMPLDGEASELEGLEIWLDELRVSGVKRDIGRKWRASTNLTLADLATVSATIEAGDGNFHNINQRVGSRRDEISGNATGTFQVHKFLNPKWGLNLPISGNLSQSETVPDYFPNSDILIDKGDPAQVDTVKDYRRSYGGGVNLSKNVPSPSPWLKYTVDNLSGRYDYSYSESSNPTTLSSNSESNSANAAYRLTFGRPSLTFLSWLKGVPILKKYSQAKLYYLLTNLNFSMSGTETISKTFYRSGNRQSNHTFNLTKTISSALRPFENQTVDYSRTHRANLLMDPAHPKGIEDILQGDLAWSEDDDISQTVNASYNPRVFSWLDTDFRYNTNYHWNWGLGYIESGQNVSNNNTITASGNLKLTQILKKPVRPTTTGTTGEQGAEPDQPGGQGQPDAAGDEGSKQSPEGESGAAGQEPEGEAGQGEGEEPEGGEPEDTTRVLPVISKPTRQSAIQDFWYMLRYTVSRLRDVRVDYTQQNTWSDPHVDGNAGLGYQLGLNSTDFTKISVLQGYATPSTRNRSDDYKFKSGLDFTRNFKVSLNYSYGWSRNESSSISGSISQSRLYFFKAGGDSIDVFELPIPDWSITWSGLEKLPMFQNVAQTVSLENKFTGSKSSSWTETRDNIRQHDFSRNFSPLLGVNITWKRGITSSLRYNWTETGKVVKFPSPSKSRSSQKGATVSGSYTMKTGFRVPIPVWPFKNRRFKNSTTIALSFNYSKSRQENEAEGSFVETSYTNTWSIKPSLDYTFSTTVSGGMHFEYGANKSKTQDSNFQEFGLRVNITIQG